jgi:RNA polymerase sigma factor (TIGR02999 family)
MAVENDDEITLLLNLSDSSGRPADKLWELVYPELRRRARNLFKNERADHTLSATAIINEVFVRLTTVSAPEWQDRTHFYSAASGIMRHVLIDHARARAADKRGGGAVRETLDENVFPAFDASESGYFEARDSLDQLALENDRAAMVVALRVFGGLTVDEIADELSISPRTVKSDWVTARVRLKSILQHQEH